MDQSKNRNCGSGSTTQRDQGAIGEQDLEESECGLIAEQQVTADDVLTRLAPEQSIRMIQTFLAMELSITTEWNLYEQACHLAVDISHHLFDTLYHAVDLQYIDTPFITADTQCFRKAAKLGCIIELTDFAPPTILTYFVSLSTILPQSSIVSLYGHKCAWAFKNGRAMVIGSFN